MNYIIIKNPKYTNLIDIGLELQPNNDPLKFFFSSMKIEAFPDLIDSIINNEGYLGSPQGVFLYEDLDGEDFAEGNIFSEDEVKVYNNYIGESILKKNKFISILLDYSQALLNQSKVSTTLSWKNDMKASIQKLNKKYHFLEH